jgi:hypothetical protein
MGSLPPSVLERVLHFSVDRPIPYNPLLRRRDEPARLENELFALIDQVTAETRGVQPLTPRMVRVLSAALRAVLREPAPSFSTLVQYLLEKPQELRPALQLGPEEFTQSWEGVLDRLSAFVRDPRIRAIIASGHELDFGRVIDDGRILLVSVAGLEPALKRFVGSLLFSGLQATIFERTPGQRRPVAVYVDEFHDFVTSPQAIATFQTLFNQGRRHLVSLTIAHTDFGTVPRELLKTIHSNADSVICFSCGPEEARTMSAVFSGEWPWEAIGNLPDFEALARVGDRLGNAVHPLEMFPALSGRRRPAQREAPTSVVVPPDPFDVFHNRHVDRSQHISTRKPRRAPKASAAASA